VYKAAESGGDPVTPVTTAWLEERGLLNDARVLAACVEGVKVRISIDDEWANERDASDKRFAGVLVFHDADILEGDIDALGGGWISELEHRGGNVVFDFCDRDRLVIRASSATWEPEVC
jgi:hypothetical protein